MIGPTMTDEMKILDDAASEPKQQKKDSRHPLLRFADFSDIREHVYACEKCDTMHRGIDEDVASWASFHPQSMTRVKLRGEPLGKILWQGTEWAVTDYGLECRDGLYHVRADKLMEGHKNHREAFNHWYQHIAEKSWVDKEDLDFALQAFMLLHTSKGNRNGRKAGGLELNDAEIEEYASRCANQAYEAALRRARLGHIEWSEFDDEEFDDDVA